MTAAVYRSGTPSLSIPQTQNTAPVLEFNCLYTHDLRKKQKKWHDGFLRFHTFNKRIMVYDIPRNYIGDMHWTAGEVLQEGDELMLEKGGAMVEVADAIGRTETDLTELRASRKKPVTGNGSSPARVPQTPAVRIPSMTASRPGTALKHRSLNALLGTSKGPVGKAALPTKSPFEVRHAGLENDAWNEGRSPKRQRVGRPVAMSVVKPAKDSTPLWARTSDAANARKKAQILQDQRSPQSVEIIELEDDAPSDKFLPGFSSDALVPPSSPPRHRPRREATAPPARSSSPAFQTQKPAMERLARETPLVKSASAAHSSATVRQGTPLRHNISSNSAASKGSAVEREATKLASRPSLPLAKANVDTPRSKKPGTALKIAASAPKKKMLVCQDQLTTKAPRLPNTDLADAPDLTGDERDDSRDRGAKTKTQRQLLDERLRKVKGHIKPITKAAAIEPMAESLDSGQTNHDGTEKSCGIKDHQFQSIVNTSSSFVDIDTMLPQALMQEQIPLGGHDESSRTDLLEIPKHPAPHSSPTVNSVRADKTTAESMHVVHRPDFPLAVVLDSHKQQGTKVKLSSPRRRRRIGRKEIRQSAQSCFPPPAESIAQAAQAAGIGDRSAEASVGPDTPDVVSTTGKAPIEMVSGIDNPAIQEGTPQISLLDHGGQVIETLKRVPGLPMRFTPSPQKQAQLVRQTDAAKASEQVVLSDQVQTAGSETIGNETTTAPAFAKPALPASKRTNKKAAKQPVTLSTATSGTAAVMLGRPFQAPKKAKVATEAVARSVTKHSPTEVPMTADPWSREAFDLFDWRPPGWDEERWCLKDVADALGETTKT
ncbi:hypothetical protein LTR78_003955 [Recurvomyces mirabilis]|uniref:5'-3' DNA helicase ZGRF1-like N-terminal domain-containing protein n=1 Tax=Recurvomyces mirabilis TaxID=574656 RepID=A0AAE0WQM9_9PEZI|nr:hypothetical protein LTR78_003955 [Recurvomyces mirabilis]KAK5153907.1 hypothetical protein LTS14_007127 [Recurvomyces mirabilis]